MQSTVWLIRGTTEYEDNYGLRESEAVNRCVLIQCFLANGKPIFEDGSVHYRPRRPSRFQTALATRFGPDRKLRDFVELFLFPSGYGGLSLVERDVANLCLVVRQAECAGLAGGKNS